MRSIRAMTTVVALVAALPSVMVAQNGRQFKDAWFWGVKGGGFTFADSAGQYQYAPVAGVEWLITRTRGGLYIGFSQAFMTTQTLFAANPSAPDTSMRPIDLKNMRKLDVTLMGFPGNHVRLHPYVGIGFTVSQVAEAEGVGPYTSVDEFDATERQILATKVGFSPTVMGGLQYRLSPISVFAQAMASPAQKNFILYNGKPVNFTVEVGLRYNVGTSISKDY
jgi:opacity protein-like surface antigen